MYQVTVLEWSNGRLTPVPYLFWDREEAETLYNGAFRNFRMGLIGFEPEMEEL